MSSHNCYCSAYSFPHRILGGNCRAIGVIQTLYEPSERECQDCISYDVPLCEVLQGKESYKYCNKFIEYCQWNEIKLN